MAGGPSVSTERLLLTKYLPSAGPLTLSSQRLQPTTSHLRMAEGSSPSEPSFSHVTMQPFPPRPPSEPPLNLSWHSMYVPPGSGLCCI